MLECKFKDLPDNTYLVEFNQNNDHVITLTSNDTIPQDTSGFYLSREDKTDRWDYSRFTTIYRVVNSKTIQFSDDGSQYVPPMKDYVVSAVWNDGNDAYGIRPAEIEAIVWLEGKKQGRDVLNPSNNWSRSHHNKPAENEYYITAPDVERYTKSISGTTVTYFVEIPQPRIIVNDDVTKAVLALYEGKTPETLANVYASYCENNELNFNEVPAEMQDAVNALITEDGFMVNEDGTVSLRPINTEGEA